MRLSPTLKGNKKRKSLQNVNLFVCVISCNSPFPQEKATYTWKIYERQLKRYHNSSKTAEAPPSDSFLRPCSRALLVMEVMWQIQSLLQECQTCPLPGRYLAIPNTPKYHINPLNSVFCRTLTTKKIRRKRSTGCQLGSMEWGYFLFNLSLSLCLPTPLSLFLSISLSLYVTFTVK